jgi:hypothetical protein
MYPGNYNYNLSTAISQQNILYQQNFTPNKTPLTTSKTNPYLTNYSQAILNQTQTQTQSQAQTLNQIQTPTQTQTQNQTFIQAQNVQ